ncbi:uncharacterized protein TNIN_442151 [Trichonephila inaurata madagascariensis]|uniref:Uncharacterized protein n=1 Tax=Trichonephila inaurata madagascariensis TaxID=2747483 RepID=A0A8X7CQ97_9ARAC|nr:uncharacterized protein TNIN_442151 [Trichonephila inaurata madagascariensis]
MIKVFGDLHPYNFFITHGHNDDKCFTDEDAHILSRERKKSEPFEKLQDMHEEDNNAVEEFHRFLKDRKRECVAVFEQFDEIVALCEEYFNLEYGDIRKRVEEQMALQKPMINEVERYLTEVQDAGDKEISILKDNIANYIRDVAVTRSNRIEEVYADMGTQPLIMEVWSICAEAVTSKDVWCSFLKTQQETALLWKKAFDDLLVNVFT